VSRVVDLTVAALRTRGDAQLHHYAETLRMACAAFPPPFGMSWYGEKYREVAVDRDWFVTSLLANAVKEAEGARDLWRLASRTGDPTIADKIRLHARDESRHARLYVAMLDVAFREVLPDEIRPTLRRLSPAYDSHEGPTVADAWPFASVLDAVIQINLGEIRTRIHQLLMTPVIMEYCPAERQRKLTRILGALMHDETRHVQYTAELIDDAMAHGHVDFVRGTTLARLDEFNRLTLMQAGETSFTGS
jgi:hypothetical protein